MSPLSGNTCDYLINSACIKLIIAECFGIIFLLFCMGVLVHAALNSDKWVMELIGVNFSLYYLYPIFLGVGGLFYLFRNFFKYYRYTVFKFHVGNGFVVFKILGLKNIKFNHFNIIAKHYRIGHWNGFKKEYFNCIGVTNNKKLYLIPVIDSKQDELIQILITHGGEMIE
ncbi:hypothetical protein [Acinetobacter oleivorans]|uniref:hypothetical protein n=1 Tax=Acinetobacter oleivorans TaxID=1148157 RepID=UPI00226C90E7|nr:hypothetical protein [Acinetobacter oleivorans]